MIVAADPIRTSKKQEAETWAAVLAEFLLSLPTEQAEPQKENARPKL